ncbi:sensor histidine kinase [Segnochrobactrum spirostomi]|uniref:histidine kinase n=1 Tax=Segnochrobactrum spirostomi TaxID=2608987 RepID=A0A6A7Y4L0_9HYPH|nr:sensor histidine kinase [Segnochrobactrum spirostomi]MQT14070.1 hypothetical protein [Segnochrobactrum spirostomi]
MTTRPHRLGFLLAILLILANIPITVLAVASGLAVHGERVEEAKRTIEQAAALAAARQALLAARVRGMADTLALAPGDLNAGDAGLCARLMEELANRSTAVQRIEVAGATGPVCAEGSEPATGAGAGDGAFSVEAPVSGGGRLTLTISAAEERRVTDGLDPPAGVVIAILDRSGHLVGTTTANPALADVPGLIAAIEKTRSSRLELRLPDGGWMFAAVSPVADTSLSVVALSPLIDIQTAAWRDFALAVGLPLGFLLIAVTVAWYGIDRLVVRWVSRLGRVAALYGAGRLSVRVGSLDGAPREMNALGSTFDEMADRIERRSQELEMAVRAKTDLLRELHHRVKNNFQLVASLLSLEARDADAVLQAALGAQQDRVHALAIAHRVAYATGEVGGVPVDLLVQEVLRALRQSAGLPNDLLDLTVTGAAPWMLDLDTAIPFALLLTELLRAALRVAADERSQVVVELIFEEQGDVILKARGPGAESPKELGARLIEAFRRQLKAEVEADFAASRFEIRIQMSSTRAAKAI